MASKEYEAMKKAHEALLADPRPFSDELKRKLIDEYQSGVLAEPNLVPPHTHEVPGESYAARPMTADEIKRGRQIPPAPERYLVSDADGLRKALEREPQPGDIVKVNRQQPKEECPEEVVHVVHQGSPLCRFTSLPPHEWPEGHYQIRYCEENLKVPVFHGCGDCFRAARKLGLEKEI